MHGGSSPGDRQAEATEEQINFVVHGFVQVWNQFEDSIAREISTRPGLRQPAHESRFGADNTLLFRVGTTLNTSTRLTMGEVSNALSVPLSTATRVVDSLVERGYVQRFRDQEDRRVVRVGFTPKGKRLYKFIDSRIAERVRKVASYLTEDEMATLIRLLTKVALAVVDTLKRV